MNRTKGGGTWNGWKIGTNGFAWSCASGANLNYWGDNDLMYPQGFSVYDFQGPDIERSSSLPANWTIVP